MMRGPGGEMRRPRCGGNAACSVEAERAKANEKHGQGGNSSESSGNETSTDEGSLEQLLVSKRQHRRDG